MALAVWALLSAEADPLAHFQDTTGVIAGIVVNERQEPMSNVIVQAFSVETAAPRQPVATSRPSAHATTDSAGRFRISGLPIAEYFVAAHQLRSFGFGAAAPAVRYGATFYPSTLDEQSAVPVPARPYATAPVHIDLIRAPGVRIAGVVTSASGHAVAGLPVRLFHRFGGFAGGADAARIGAGGAFEIAGVPPGSYRVIVGVPRTLFEPPEGEFASVPIEVRDRDVEGLALRLDLGASVAGRIVLEPGADVFSAVGIRVGAEPVDGLSGVDSMVVSASPDWSFRMRGLSGSYRFMASADRALVKLTRLVVDGVAAAPDAMIDLTSGAHDIVAFVGPRQPPAVVQTASTSTALVEQFKNEQTFWRQFIIAQAIAERHDTSVLAPLAGWLTHEDRHLRGNAAFVFARLGDARGFQAIVDMLGDRSDRPEGQGVALASSDGRYHLEPQIAADRYYAAHLLGDLRDPRAIPILVPLLKDRETRSIVPWALGQIGNRLAVAPLLDALNEDDPSMRVLIIYALDALRAREAIPRLTALLEDRRRSNFGATVTVADAARAALDKLYSR